MPRSNKRLLETVRCCAVWISQMIQSITVKNFWKHVGVSKYQKQPILSYFLEYPTDQIRYVLSNTNVYVIWLSVTSVSLVGRYSIWTSPVSYETIQRPMFGLRYPGDTRTWVPQNMGTCYQTFDHIWTPVVQSFQHLKCDSNKTYRL